MVNYRKLIKNHLEILSGLKTESGLFYASNPTVTTGYNKAWIRDNVYDSIAFETVGDWDTVKKIYGALLDIFRKYEEKIDRAIANKPKYARDYIHARYNPLTFNEFPGKWGNKQNDSIGCVLFGIGKLEKQGISILRDDADKRIVQKLVNYLSSLEYWHDVDSGMWEENEEIHASSIGACVAGLDMVKKIKGIEVKNSLIKKGRVALNKLLPRESEGKFVDLSLLSLIWPYSVTSKKQTNEILENVKYHLLKKKGVIRYRGDKYYNKNIDHHSEEAEWTFGLSWMAIIYNELGEKEEAWSFLKRALKTTNKGGEIPELYYSDSNNPDENMPLGWSESLFISAIYKINEMNSKTIFKNCKARKL